MKPFKTLMVALDLSSMDKTLISYVGKWSKEFHPDKIYFINVQEKLDYPDQIKKYFTHPEIPRDEYYQNWMKEEVERVFPDFNDFDVEYVVEEGSRVKTVLKWAHVKNIDLLVVGRKDESEGSGIVSRSMARKVHCSTLFVPQNHFFNLETILVGVDFSERSKKAFQKGLDLGDWVEKVKVRVAHIFRLPSGYYDSNDREKIVLDHVKGLKTDEFARFAGSTDPNSYEFDLVFDEDVSFANTIYNHAKEVRADLLVVGERGTSLMEFLLGSIAEKMINKCKDIPLLITKEPSPDKKRFWNIIQP